MMGKLAIFFFAAWAGLQNGGVVAGLAMAGKAGLVFAA
jgi:hypothetical protein